LGDPRRGFYRMRGESTNLPGHARSEALAGRPPPAAEREDAVPGAGASGHDGRARPPPRPARRQRWRAWRRWLRRPAAAGPATGSWSSGHAQAAALSTRTPPSGRPGHSSASTAGTGHRRGRLVGRRPDRAAVCGQQRRGRAGHARTLRPRLLRQSRPASRGPAGLAALVNRPRPAWAGGHGMPTGAATGRAFWTPRSPLNTCRSRHPRPRHGPAWTLRPRADQTADARASRLSQRQRARRAPCVTRPPWRHVTTLLAGVCAVRAGVGSSRIAAADQTTVQRVVRRMP
jgi:hypothetical protein